MLNGPRRSLPSSGRSQQTRCCSIKVENRCRAEEVEIGKEASSINVFLCTALPVCIDHSNQAMPAIVHAVRFRVPRR